LSIDFGTSNTAAAFRRGDREPVELRLSEGSLLPSAVYVESDSSMLVGHDAIGAASIDPRRFVPAPKRLIGDPDVPIGDRDLPVSDLVAAVLQDVMRTAHVHASPAFDSIVLTHPEQWGDARKKVLSQAAGQAGIPERQLTLVSEPQAAARFYTSSKDYVVPNGTKICVFDFGAGTLDIAVLNKIGDTFEVEASDGDPALGGLDFDQRIVDWLRDQFDDPAVVAALDAPRNRAALMETVRKSKESLSRRPHTTIVIPGLPDDDRGLVMLTRDDFNELIKGHVVAAADLTRRTMAKAGAPADGSVLVYLTGGTSSVPLVQHEIGHIGNIERLHDPKTVVARGALLTPVISRRDLPPPPPPPPPPPEAGRVVYVPPLEAPGQVRRVFKTQGDVIAQGEPILEFTAGRGLFALYAPASGTLKQLNVNVGSTMTSATVLGIVGRHDLTVIEARGLPAAYARVKQLPPPSPNPGPVNTGPVPGGHGGAPITNNKATIAMVCALCSLFCGLTSIFAIVLGSQAKREINASGGAQIGLAQAKVGVVFGWIGFAVMISVGIYVLSQMPVSSS
jgi:molecular chaperone DnaK